MTVFERARLSPRGPGIHRTATCKVYGSIQNITRLSTQHTWLARSTNSWSLNSRRRANRATTAFDSDACSRTSHHCSVRSSQTTQGLSRQACACHAYSANASCWKMAQMLARSTRMPPCHDKIEAAEPERARSCSSRPPQAARRYHPSCCCAGAAAAPR